MPAPAPRNQARRPAAATPAGGGSTEPAAPSPARPTPMSSRRRPGPRTPMPHGPGRRGRRGRCSPGWAPCGSGAATARARRADHDDPRPPQQRRRWRRGLVLAVLVACWWSGSWSPAWRTPPGHPAGTPRPRADRLAATIAQDQDRLRRLPDDAGTGPRSGRPMSNRPGGVATRAYYGQAQGALERSLALQPAGNAAAAVGLARWPTRHDFTAARGHAEQALALNPVSAEANGVRADAATQLGDTATATAAVQRMLDLRPGGGRVQPGPPTSWNCTAGGRGADGAERALAAATAATSCLSHFYLGSWLGRRRGARPARSTARVAAAPGDPMLLSGQGQGAGGDRGSTRRSPPTSG